MADGSAEEEALVVAEEIVTTSVPTGLGFDIIPSTAQLEADILKHANPFDANFREANSLRESGKSVPLELKESEGSSSKLSPFLSRKLSNAGVPPLNIKLPSTLTSQSLSAFSNIDVLGMGALETPDIARLVRNTVERESTKEVPGTAELLENMLDIQTAARPASPEVDNGPSPQQPVDSGGSSLENLQAVISAQSMNDTHTSELIPDSIPEREFSGGVGKVTLSVRVGEAKPVEIPLDVELGVSADGSKMAPTVSVASTGVSMAKEGTRPPPTVIAPPPLPQPHVQPRAKKVLFRPPSFNNTTYKRSLSGARRYQQMAAAQRAQPQSQPQVQDSAQMILSTGDKQREVMDRNRAAAVRYRQRKKAEQTKLQTELEALKQENLQLSTQNYVLRSEVTRVNRLLQGYRKNCKCNFEEPEEEQMEEEEDLQDYGDLIRECRTQSDSSQQLALPSQKTNRLKTPATSEQTFSFVQAPNNTVRLIQASSSGGLPFLVQPMPVVGNSVPKLLITSDSGSLLANSHIALLPKKPN